jgi:cytochrome c oxidase subunit 2
MRFVPSSLVRVGRFLAALAGLLLLSGCDLNFWRMDGHQSTMIAEGPVARSQLNLFYVTCWVTLVIFILVGGVLAYTMWRFRARTEADERAAPPPQSHGNPLVEISLIGASVLALVIIAVPTLTAIWYTHDVPEAEKKNAYEVTATGYQWWFKFEYPAEQAAVDTAGAKTPLVTGNELVIPAGRPVRINVRTVDVIHSFWVPKLGGKIDMIPNRANFFWLQADKPGYFWGQCAEYCGDSHAVMRFRVIALDEKDFAAWKEKQLALARSVAAPAAPAAAAAPVAALRAFKTNEVGVSEAFDRNPLEAWRSKQAVEKDENPALIAQGRELFAAKTCNACHAVRGHGAMGVQGPDLTHFGARTTVGAGLIENNPEQLRRWIRDPESVKPGNKMAKAYRDNKITLSDAEQVALTAYLLSLK